MSSQAFENFLLMIAGSPFSRLFFCKKDIWGWLEPCVATEVLFETSDYIMFQSFLPESGKSFVEFKGKTCLNQQCRSCKGYGLIHPMFAYNHLYTLGLSSFRKILESEWIDIIHSESLFNTLCNIYETPSCIKTICEKCLIKNKCSLKNARRSCVPVELTNQTKQSPFFDPPPKSGIFPFLFDDNIYGMVLCNNTTIRAGSSGIVQSGMKDDPRFYAAKLKSALSIIEVPQHVWDIAYQYAIARHYKFSFRMKPFIPTVNIHMQFHFGQDFKKIEDHSDFLWRFRPLIKQPFIADLNKVGPKPKKEVLPFNLDYYSVANLNLSYYNRINMGLRKVFGYKLNNFDGPIFKWNRLS